MKNRSLILILVVIGLLVGAYYFIAPKMGLLPGKKFDTATLDELPSNVNGFIAMDLSSGTFANYVANPGYQKYITEYNKLLTGDTLKGMQTYFGFLERLGMWPKVGAPFEPSMSNMVWFTVKEENKLQLGLVGTLASAKANGTLINELSSFLKSNNFTVTDLTYGNGKGFSFDIFAAPPLDLSDAPAPFDPVSMYRLIIGKRTIYLGEARGKVMIATSKNLMEEIVKDPTGKAKPKLLESPNYIKAMAQLSGAPSDFGVGYVDMHEIVSAIGGENMPSDLKSIPFTYAAASYGGNEGISGKFLFGMEAQNDNQKKIFAAAESLTPYSAFKDLPDKTALAISISGQALKAAKKVIDQEDLSTVPPPVMEKLALLTSIDEVTISAKAATQEGSWPEGLVEIKSSVTGELAKMTKELVGQAFGGNAPWKPIELEGLKSEFILTPFNVGLYFAESGDKFFFATSPDAMKVLGKAQRGEGLAIDNLGNDSRKLLTEGRVGWGTFDYKVIAEVVAGFEKSMGAFMPQEQKDAFKIFDSMKYMGKVGFGLGYSNGAVEVLFFQELDKEVK